MLERDNYEPKAQKRLPLRILSEIFLDKIESLFVYICGNHCTGQGSPHHKLCGSGRVSSCEDSKVCKTLAIDLIVMPICQSSMHCDEARAFVTAHQMSDPKFLLCSNCLRPDLLRRWYKLCKNYWLNWILCCAGLEKRLVKYWTDSIDWFSASTPSMFRNCLPSSR